MKTLSLLCSVLVVAGGLFMAGCATTSQVEVPGTLKVQVNMPPTLHYLAEDRISEAFVDRIRDVFAQNGFNRPVEEVSFVEAPTRIPYLLTVNLTEWRVDRLGNIDCTFSADLQTPTATRHLGHYSNTTLRLARGFGRFGLANAFTDAADGAIRSLCLDIQRTELLPNLRQVSRPVI
jgi:hypothetical protein